MNVPFPPKIIFFDIDDTLYIKGGRIAPNTERALHALKARGIITAIATGRTPCVLPDVIRRLMADSGIDILAAVNGQCIRYRGGVLADFVMEKQQYRELAAYLDGLDVAYAAVCEHGIYVPKESEGMRQAMRDLGIAYLPPQAADGNAPVFQMLAFYPESRAAEVEAGLPGYIKSVRWHREGVDLLDKHASKARGIRAVLDKLGLQMSDAMAFGDGLNDLEMLEAVGFGVAMGNAVAELKARADYIAPPAAADGIFRALCDLGVIEPL